MSRGKSNKTKRTINSGLKAWNDARSYIAAENRKLGKKYSFIELNALTKGFLSEHYGKSFDKKDLQSFLKQDVPEFYSSALNVSDLSLQPCEFYDIDNQIRTIEKGIDVKVVGGKYGTTSFNTANYNYHSGVSEIVEEIRRDLFPDNTTRSGEAQWVGLIKKLPKSLGKGKEKRTHYIEYVLFIAGNPVSEIGQVITPKGFNEIPEAQKKSLKERINEKYKAKKKKAAEAKKAAPAEKKEDVQALKLKLQILNKVEKLIKLGYTKKEIDKLLKG